MMQKTGLLFSSQCSGFRQMEEITEEDYKNLIAKNISQKVVKEAEGKNIKCLKYSFNRIDNTQTYTIDYLETNFNLDKI